MPQKLGFYSFYGWKDVVFSLYRCQKLIFEIFDQCLGDSNMAPKWKKPSIFCNLASRLGFFSGPGNRKEASPTIFHYFLGCTWPPQPLGTSKKNLVRLQNFSKTAPEVPIFRCRESRIRDSETRFRDSKSSGISRVKTRLNAQKPAPRRKKYQHSISAVVSCKKIKT